MRRVSNFHIYPIIRVFSSYLVPRGEFSARKFAHILDLACLGRQVAANKRDRFFFFNSFLERRNLQSLTWYRLEFEAQIDNWVRDVVGELKKFWQYSSWWELSRFMKIILFGSNRLGLNTQSEPESGKSEKNVRIKTFFLACLEARFLSLKFWEFWIRTPTPIHPTLIFYHHF